MRRAQDRARSARSRKNGARSATIESRALGALKLASEARNENVPAKRADFFIYLNTQIKSNIHRKFNRTFLYISPFLDIFQNVKESITVRKKYSR